MASNATILIVVTAMAVLVLTGACALVVYKMRTKGDSAGLTLRTQIDEDLSRFRRQEELADELDARVIAERGELDVRTVSE